MDDEEYSYAFNITVGDQREEVPLYVVNSSAEINVQEVRDSNEERVAVQTPEQVKAYRETPFGRLATQEPLIGGGWSIFRVPAHVREVEKGAYTPKIVSIGPFHRNELGQGGVRVLEVQKMRFLSRLQNRVSCEVLPNAMKEMEEKTRKCYSEDFHCINSDDFVRMMLLDGCFIVELLRLYAMRTYPQGNDHHVVKEPILETRWMVPNIGRDLLMLENQLPMFVLQKIFDITTLERNATPLNKLALRFFEPLRPQKEKLADDILNTEEEYPHLLALFQSTFKPPKPKDYRRSRPERDDLIPGKGWVHNATTLAYAGIRFKKKSGNFLDIKYKHRELTIPTLFIDDGSSTLLRNMIAYEQSNSCGEEYFSYFAVFMDSIVDTVNDINILRRAGIIKQAKGGDQEVVNLFNSLTKGVEIDMDDCYMIEQIENINSRCRSHENMVRFRRFLSKMKFKGVISAYISTVLTLIYIWNSFIIPDPSNSDPSAAPPSS